MDQDDIVRQALGSRINKGGTCHDIARGANGWHTGKSMESINRLRSCFATLGRQIHPARKSHGAISVSECILSFMVILKKSYSWAATGNDIAEAFNGWNGWRTKSFKHKSIQILIDELVSHGPVMVGTEEHACLLTHIYYTKDYSGNPNPFNAILINPKTAKEEVRNWSDFFPAINTIVSIWR